MAKESGMGDQLYVAGYDLSGDIGSVDTISGGPAPLDVTGIDKSAHERLGGLRDGRIEYTAFFNPSANQAHDRLSNLPTTDQIVTYAHGTVLGNASACEVAKQINYDPSRGADGSLTFKVQALANGFGVEWGRQLTAGKRTDGGAANGTGVDSGASSTFGLQAYLQVFAFTGTDCVIKIQESSDNAGADPYADVVGGAFSGVTTAPQAQRLTTAGNLTVERWLRVITTTSGGFSSITFAVTVARNLTATAF